MPRARPLADLCLRSVWRVVVQHSFANVDDVVVQWVWSCLPLRYASSETRVACNCDPVTLFKVMQFWFQRGERNSSEFRSCAFVEARNGVAYKISNFKSPPLRVFDGLGELLLGTP